MPENPIQEAKFDHVGPDGELVFAVRGMLFGVMVDDTLEHAILEAKQLRTEQVRQAQPAQTQGLPISQIQALIRAGAEPEQVAQRYGLSETLVRRFSSGGETEKQYAIEQFFMLPAPKDSRVHTMSELIERTLAAAGIGMESVSWTATRRGLEPWKITARFESAGRHVTASWSWNMRDNAVACLDATAKKLIGENRADDTQGDGPNFPISLNIPGNSVRSARIERAVSAWREPQDADKTPGALRSNARAAAPSTPIQPGNGEQPQQAPNRLAGPSVPASPSSPQASATGEQQPREQHSATGKNAAHQQTPPLPAKPGHSETPVNAPATSNTDQDGDPDRPQAASSDDQSRHTSKRAHGRGRKMPSWDEILFGD
ncbi:septation protein SepH [Bifidobacterium thermophilum]|uniref:septation protein SepH n=1 Tax=Bifidobacterium thermophilum TaxID=33905 RepID=UPI0030A5CB21